MFVPETCFVIYVAWQEIVHVFVHYGYLKSAPMLLGKYIKKGWLCRNYQIWRFRGVFEVSASQVWNRRPSLPAYMTFQMPPYMIFESYTICWHLWIWNRSMNEWRNECKMARWMPKKAHFSLLRRVVAFKMPMISAASFARNSPFGDLLYFLWLVISRISSKAPFNAWMNYNGKSRNEDVKVFWNKTHNEGKLTSVVGHRCVCMTRWTAVSCQRESPDHSCHWSG